MLRCTPEEGQQLAPGLLWVRATGTSSCLTLGAENSSASLSPSPTLTQQPHKRLAEAEAQELTFPPRLRSPRKDAPPASPGEPSCVCHMAHMLAGFLLLMLTGSQSPGGP